MYNDTISNTPQGVHVNAETDGTTGQSPMKPHPAQQHLLQRRQRGADDRPESNGQNAQLHVSILAMDNIFDGSSIDAVDVEGQCRPTPRSSTTCSSTTPPTSSRRRLDGSVSRATSTPVFGDPKFVDAAAGNFALQPTSAAIDAARSEIGPIAGSDAIYPDGEPAPVQRRTAPAPTPPRWSPPEQPGADNLFGGFGYPTVTDPQADPHPAGIGSLQLPG